MSPTRVRRIGAVLSGIAIAAVLSGCVSAPSSGSGGGAERDDDGRLVFGIGTAVDCFDPQISPSSVTSSITRNLYDSLVARNPDGTFSPWLATEWDISGDGLAYTFSLRDDVTFHDGTPFNAEAVQINLDRIVDPATASQFAGGLIKPYERTEIVDEHTVTVHLKTPYGPFLTALSSANLGFHSPASLEEYGDDLCQGGAAQVGTGPFTFASVSDGEGFVFARNDDYNWAAENAGHTGPAYLAEAEFRVIPERSVLVGALSSNEVDVIDQIGPSDVETVSAVPGVTVNKQEPTGIPYTYFFNTASGPFQDERARIAIQKALDLDALSASVFQGAYAPASGPLNPATLFFDAASGDSIDVDPAAAGALLDELGYDERDADGYRVLDGERLSLALIYDPTYQRPERITFDTAVQDALRAVGVELTITPIGDGSYIDVRNSGAYDIIAFAWDGTDPDVLRTIYGGEQQFGDGGANASQVVDADLDALLERGLLSTDPDERADVYGQAQRLIIERGYGLPAYVAPIVTAYGERVNDLAYGADMLPGLYDAWVPTN